MLSEREEFSKERGGTSSPFLAALHFTAASRTCVIVLALMLSGPALAAGFTCAPPTVSNGSDLRKEGALGKLEEVVINGNKPKGSKDLHAWLKLLAGQYSYEGYVDLCGKGDPADQRPVTGKADCHVVYVPREPISNLYCMINVRWPEVRGEYGTTVMGGASTLSPAMVVYGIEPDLPGIQFMQINNEGITEHARGKLVGDTLTSSEVCVGIPGACQKITRITAKPGSSDIAMLIDVELESHLVLRQAFLMHRVSNISKNLLEVGSTQ